MADKSPPVPATSAVQALSATQIVSPSDYTRLARRTEKIPSDLGHLDLNAVPMSLDHYRCMHAALGIAGEAGELVDIVKKMVIYKNRENGETRDKVIEEVGDLLWYIPILCDVFGFSLEEAMSRNIDKLKRRYPEKYSDALAAIRADKKDRGDFSQQ